MKSGLKWKVVAWTSLIAGYVNNDCATEAIRVFKDMENFHVEPNEITLVHVLVTCARSRDLGTGKLDHRFIVIHYYCMVDLLSRAGRFEEAERLLEQMPIQPNIAVWGALLNGSEIQENVNLADQVRRLIREVETVGSGVYVLVANIYARAGKWQEAKMARELMKHKSIVKTLGHKFYLVDGILKITAPKRVDESSYQLHKFYLVDGISKITAPKNFLVDCSRNINIRSNYFESNNNSKPTPKLLDLEKQNPILFKSITLKQRSSIIGV
ncbi:hypothetical protein EZV62_006856 [Acer yangbiense]|uniref:Pentatricopeptide repeat-containing protein n=1 Tax=Acer yangbiense TaxID=1000413 RepID=A0A5C7I8W9_9ROSI|nr:hypothetical protein EZV62_006856 [Acer yangbiense]